MPEVNKSELIELYNDALVLGYNLNLESVANYPLKVIYPGKTVEELSESELVTLIKAVVTGLTGQVC